MTHYWYRRRLHPLLWPLIPLEWLFRLVVWLRFFCYRAGIFRVYRAPVPVIVVGNITVGGTGKTPFVIWLAQFLKTQGYTPGIVTRGYGGPHHHTPYRVTAATTIKEVGEEVLLLAQKTACPVVVAIDRAQAVKSLLAQSACNIIISEDGLQHYALGRNYEIVLINHERQLGNQHVLPAGPLREPACRLKRAQLVIQTGRGLRDDVGVCYLIDQLVSMQNNTIYPLSQFAHKKIHAVAGIAYPEAFFKMLREAGFEVIPHVFPDHHHFCKKDIIFDDILPVVMTEKDSVKCKTFADERHWFLPLQLVVGERISRTLANANFHLEHLSC